MDRIKIAFFTHQNIITAVEYLRVFGPISYTDMEILMGIEYINNLFDFIKDIDIVLIQRDFPNDFGLFNQIFNISRAQKKPVVYDLDDNLFDLPKNHPDRESFVFARAMIPMIRAITKADYITVSSKYLENKLTFLNQNILVLPNYLDKKIWSFRSPDNQKSAERVTIGYMGGNTHKPDIELITPILLTIKDEYAERVRFNFYGLKPPDRLLSFPDTTWTPIKTYVYKEFAEDFQKIDVDFFIAPLNNNEFNRCKSNIKYLEYSSLGVPGIFSNVYPYKEIITDGVNGLHANSSLEWEEKIRMLIENPELRYRLADNAQNFINENFLMSKNSFRWKEAYQNIINQGITEQIFKDIPFHFFDSFIKQLNEYHIDLSSQLRGKTKALDELKTKYSDLELNKQILTEQIKILEEKNQILQTRKDNLEEEILYYALSNSWQITRPFRKIKRIFGGEK